MLTAAPHLQTRRPSPTTAEFTVTTRPSPTTLPLRALLLLAFFLRAALALSALMLLYCAWAASSFSSSSSTTTSATLDSLGALETLQTLHAALERLRTSTTAGRALAALAALLPPWALVPTALAALYLSALRLHASESLLVLRGLGIQTSSSGRTYLPFLSSSSSGRARFIPTEKIRDVLINEAFRGFEVRYYLVVVVDGEEDVVVVFPRLLPPLAIVRAVWAGARACLYEPDGGGGGGGERTGGRRGWDGRTAGSFARKG